MALDKLAPAFGTGNADRFGDLFCILAFGEAAARDKVAVASPAFYHLSAAFIADFVDRLRGVTALLGRLAVAVERFGILALGIARAGGKFAVPPVFYYHSSAALIAEDVGFFDGEVYVVL